MYRETTRALDRNAGDPGGKLGPRGLISGASSVAESALMAASETAGGRSRRLVKGTKHYRDLCRGRSSRANLYVGGNTKLQQASRSRKSAKPFCASPIAAVHSIRDSGALEKGSHTVHEKQNETKRCDINYSKHSVAMESPGTVAVQWTGEKFRLPLPGGDFSGGDDAIAAGVEEVGALAQIEATEATEGSFVRNGEGDERGDGLDNDLHLRITAR